MPAATKITLPPEVISPTDISRLRRSSRELADYLRQADLSGRNVSPPGNHLLSKFAEANSLDLSKVGDCERAGKLLDELSEIAPKIHISFAAEPSNKFMQKIAGWFRSNINPLTLLTIGLQPSVAAGCYLRTTNRYFDLSLRRHLLEKSQILIDKLEGLNKDER